eukprot:TRINITY_DN50532_c0_g2_i1.p1 TRINITY_DN50532_c0_g2~~TRINITY_DN50532_c0_g2_i1.p1  ORF type:complete len:392 (-),score=37.92 TRINITY_DN50532_c0_g2_i1:81-1226(-)
MSHSYRYILKIFNVNIQKQYQIQRLPEISPLFEEYTKSPQLFEDFQLCLGKYKSNRCILSSVTTSQKQISEKLDNIPVRLKQIGNAIYKLLVTEHLQKSQGNQYLIGEKQILRSEMLRISQRAENSKQLGIGDKFPVVGISGVDYSGSTQILSQLYSQILASKLVDSGGSLFQCRSVYYKSTKLPMSLSTVKMMYRNFFGFITKSQLEDLYRIQSSRIQSVEDFLNYKFRDKSLLVAALSHPSLSPQFHPQSFAHQELEWLGDAVIELLVTIAVQNSMLQQKQLSYPETQKLLSKSMLSAFSRTLNLDRDYQLSAQKEPTDRILVDILEAIMGCMYIDGGGTMYSVGDWFFSNWPSQEAPVYMELLPEIKKQQRSNIYVTT